MQFISKLNRPKIDILNSIRFNFILILIFFSFCASSLIAQQPICSASVALNYGTGISVDGNIADWDINNDFFANMYNNGDPAKALLAKAYVRYDCNNEVLYVLVNMEPGANFVMSNEDSWVRIVPTKPPIVDGDSGDDGIPPDFAYTTNGFEASLNLDSVGAPISVTNGIEIHINSPNNADPMDIMTVSTGKISQDEQICYILSCSTSPGTPSPSITINKNDNDDGDDFQKIVSGATANFKIVVKNTGSDTLCNVTVTDALSSDCDSVFVAKLPPGDSLEYTCFQTNVTSDFINKAVVTATGSISNQSVMDMDTTFVKIGVPIPGFSITNRLQGLDPCSCNNDQSSNGAGDGTFTETATVISAIAAPNGFKVGAGSTPVGLINMPFDTNSTNDTFRLTFNHVDRIGFNLLIEDGVTGAPILVNANQLGISNVCKYPIINEPIIDDICPANRSIDLPSLISTPNGSVSAMLTPPMGVATPIISFDPSTAATGTYMVQWTFDSDSINNFNGTFANPACPGCVTMYSTSFVLVPDCPVAPVLSEWSLIILTLLLLIFGVLAIRSGATNEIRANLN